MAQAYRWRPNDLVEFAGAEASAGFAPLAHLSAGGVHVSRGKLAANDGVEIGAAQLVAAVIESEPFDVEWRAPGEDRLRHDWLLPHSAQIVPAGHPFFLRWRVEPTILSIAFDPDLVDRVRDETGARRRDEVRTQLGVRDPEIEAVAAKLRLELQHGAPSGPLYVESLGVILAVHLMRHHIGERPRRRAAHGGLGACRLRRIIEYVEAHLGETVTLAEMAEIAGLSPHYFASAFRASTGLPPHRYLMERRIARGRELLVHTDATVTMIAHTLGFASHGHFTENFRRFVGVTPSQFRADRR